MLVILLMEKFERRKLGTTSQFYVYATISTIMLHNIAKKSWCTTMYSCTKCLYSENTVGTNFPKHGSVQQRYMRRTLTDILLQTNVTRSASKLRLTMVVVWPVATHGCEALTLTKKMLYMLVSHFHLYCTIAFVFACMLVLVVFMFSISYVTNLSLWLPEFNKLTY